MPTQLKPTLAAIAFLIAGSACGGDSAGPAYNPVIPTQFSSAISNPFWTFTPGTTWNFSGQTDEGLETTVVEALDETRLVNGVTARVVRDRVYVDGKLVEDTYDWYAQDAAGNVWYLGEDSKEMKNGVVVDTEGSWEWGKDGALPGIVMWADPQAHIGESYRQEYLRGEAEDFAKILAVNESVVGPLKTYTGCVKSEEWSAIESNSTEFKFFCPGVGLVLEVSGNNPAHKVQLMSMTTR